MLTVEQYRSEEMSGLYQQYLGAGPLKYVADLLGSQAEALAFYGPLYLLYSVYDDAEDILDDDGEIIILKVEEEKNGDTYLCPIEDAKEYICSLSTQHRMYNWNDIEVRLYI